MTITIKLLGVVFAVLFCMTGCAAKHLTDETLNKIALCTGGLGSSYNLNAKIQASIDEKKKNIAGDMSINYEEIIHGVIFAQQDLSDDLKKQYYEIYVNCIHKIEVRNAPAQKTEININSSGNVVSVCQQGGITAHTLTFNPVTTNIINNPQISLPLMIEANLEVFPTVTAKKIFNVEYILPLNKKAFVSAVERGKKYTLSYTNADLSEMHITEKYRTIPEDENEICWVITYNFPSNQCTQGNARLEPGPKARRDLSACAEFPEGTTPTCSP